MRELVRNIRWIEKSMDFESLEKHSDSFDFTPLESGLEAEVIKICTPESGFVLKIWNRHSKPEVGIQYKLLDVLYRQGKAVSKPIGWGIDESDNPVLLTSFDGLPVNRVDQSKLTQLAKVLLDIHKVPLESLGDFKLPQHEFVRYFYPGIHDHPDIENLLVQLVERAKIKQDSIIHGDYNLGNILEKDGNYTVIDWTNGQPGDPRFDMAWSNVLIRIYVSEKYYSVYRSAFLSETNYTDEELLLFEAIACLRWILLNRIAVLPKRKNTISRVKTLLLSNPYLHAKLL